MNFAVLAKRIAMLALCVSLAFAPLAVKVRFFGVGLSLSDIGIGVAFVLLLPTTLLELRTRGWLGRIAISVPFVICAGISALAATNLVEALREFAQIGLYLIVATWCFTLVLDEGGILCFVGYALRLALTLAATVAILRFLGASAIAGSLSPPQYTLTYCYVLIVILLFATRSLQDGPVRIPDRILCLTSGICVAISLLAGSIQQDAETIVTKEPVAQRFLEAYASINVVGQYPLFGVGPGNYQERIGEFYFGLPKDNSIVLGTRVGYGVLLASTGLIGVSAFLYWIGSLATRALRAGPRGRPLVWFFGSLFLCGAFTPLLVSPLMIPVAMAQGLVVRRCWTSYE
jgi:hypothetical protein